MTLEMGKTLRYRRGREMRAGACRYYAEQAESLLTPEGFETGCRMSIRPPTQVRNADFDYAGAKASTGSGLKS